ncbi:AraC family transcriptional regulator [Herbaspirillum rubrisubalbicans Os34]|uniref:AraC family transcriptional regulator n=1 Tax=Herbaspirillum rubrisubalbicans Os34 TaxID=1235827 RepID=A0A6M3ZL03_9BURK|nr:AraC family transcriptional regulator [Herbaspirillum rubrisubalbicans Os34]
MPLLAFLIDIHLKRQGSVTAGQASTEIKLATPNAFDEFFRETGIRVEAPTTEHSKASYEGEYFPIPVGAAYRSTSKTGWQVRHAPEASGYSLHIQRSGETSWTSAKEALYCSSGSAIIQNLEQVRQLAGSSASSDEGLFFPVQCLTRKLSHLLDAPVHKPIRFHYPLIHDPHVLAPLRSIIDIIAQGLSGKAPLIKAPLALVNLQQAAAYMILQNLPHNYSHVLASHPPAPAPRQIKRAVEFIRASLAVPISLADIAEHSAISVRSLQLGFRKYKGMTPMEFLRTQRLGRVREDLLDPSVPADVQHIALSWGFTHFYLFVRYYKKLFGESPQTTLMRRE